MHARKFRDVHPTIELIASRCLVLWVLLMLGLSAAVHRRHLEDDAPHHDAAR